jgi:hypothetical protein
MIIALTGRVLIATALGSISVRAIEIIVCLNLGELPNWRQALKVSGLRTFLLSGGN